MPSAAMIATVAALLIVLLPDNVAPESSTGKMQCYLREETIFAQTVCQPHTTRTRTVRNYNQAVMPR
jgi:hypothetical protein